MKTVILTFALIFGLSYASMASNEVPYRLDDDKIQITCNTSKGDASIVWSDTRIEFIEIVASNGQFMPTIPVADAKSLHMNDLMSGTYTLIFKSATEQLYERTIEVIR
ncbi:MAG: hypothetical protein EBR54_04440 [Flavobacteriia bacterium]|nr:hypothetical protein [Flavobacteriia bacterium]NBX38650.1 hypothetical protein [Flavobacteriia bacterium]NCU77197.1 hypothetical protein [Synechococcaceae bacterium WB7_1C_051]NCU92507.1 hypothetical protein [Synechococcaceae bacterium WB7_1B_046]